MTTSNNLETLLGQSTGAGLATFPAAANFSSGHKTTPPNVFRSTHDQLCGRLHVLLGLYDSLVGLRLVVHGHRGLQDGAQRRQDGLKGASPLCRKDTKILLYAKINIMSELAREDLAALASSPSQPMPATNGSSQFRGEGRGSTAL